MTMKPVVAPSPERLPERRSPMLSSLRARRVLPVAAVTVALLAVGTYIASRLLGAREVGGEGPFTEQGLVTELFANVALRGGVLVGVGPVAEADLPGRSLTYRITRLGDMAQTVEAVNGHGAPATEAPLGPLFDAVEAAEEGTALAAR